MRYRFGDFTLDLSRRALLCAEGDLGLTPKEFLTLSTLVEAKGAAVSRETLISAVWPDAVVGDSSLARNVSALRKHLGKEAIEVVPKFGYRLTLTVSPELPREPAITAPVEIVDEVQPASSRRPSWVSAGGRWVAVGVLVALVLASSGRLREVWAASAQRGTWSDPQTGLTWTRADNGRNLSRVQAIAYCKSLDLAGKRDWRLPTIEELQTLHDPAVAMAGTWGLPGRKVYWHVKGGIHVTGGETASDVTLLTEQTPAGEEQSYDFSYERRNFDPDGFSLDHRALCVR